MTFDLWDVELGKYLGQFDTEEEALTAVRDLLDRFGDAYAADLELGRSDDDVGRNNLTGAALVERIRRAALVGERAQVAGGA